jgi:hypothetical protein
MLDAVQISLSEDLAVFDGERRIADADAIDLPEHLGAGLGPFAEQAGFGTDAIAIRATPLRPVAWLGGNLCECDLCCQHPCGETRQAQLHLHTPFCIQFI